MALMVTLTPCSCVRELQGSNQSWNTDCPVVDCYSLSQISLNLLRIQQGRKIPVFSTTTISALGPIQPPVQWVGVLSRC